MNDYIPTRFAICIGIVLVVITHDSPNSACAAEEAAAIEYLKSSNVFSAIQRNEDGEVIAVTVGCTYGLWDDPRAYGKKWLPKFAEHLRALPKLEKVFIHDWVYSDDDMRHLANIPQLALFTNSRAFGNAEPFTGSGLIHLVMPASLRVLHPSGGITDESLQHVGRLRSLARLRLSSTNITDAGLKHLKPLNLIGLDIRYANKITGEGFLHLAHMRQMRTLTLDNNKIHHGLKHFAAMAELHYLDLTDNQLTDDELSHLAKLTQLTELKLGRNKIADAALVHLRPLNELRTLDLSDNEIRGPGVKHLAALANVEKILLHKNAEMGDENLEALIALPKLNSVTVSETNVRVDALRKFRQQRPDVKISFRPSFAFGLGEHWHVRLDDDWQVVSVSFSDAANDQDLAQLGSNPEFANVEHLSFPFPQRITGKGLVHLKALKRLKQLHLDECDVGDEGLKHLGQIASLEELEIDEGGLTGAGLKHLAGLTELRHLALTNNGLEDADMAFLRGLTKLESVRIAGNSVSAEGIAKYLKEAKKLNRLDLSSDTFRGDHVITGEALKRLQEETKP